MVAGEIVNLTFSTYRHMNKLDTCTKNKAVKDGLNLCPACDRKGKLVCNQTVRYVVKKNIVDRVGYFDFYLCCDSECRVGYFNNDIKQVVETWQFLTPLWFKSNSKIVYACHCRNITKQEVIKTVLETNLNDRHSIMLYLRGDLPHRCHIANPTGESCARAFIQMIDEALKIKKVLLRYRQYDLDSIQINKKALEHYSGTFNPMGV